MAITVNTLKQNLLQALTPQKIKGPSSAKFASAVAKSFVSYLPAITVSTTHVGVAGAGTGTGNVALPAQSGIPILYQNLKSVGLDGPATDRLSKGVSQGFSSEIQQNGTVQVVVTGTATGTGTGTLVGLRQQDLFKILLGNFNFEKISGTSAKDMAKGLSGGLVTWLQTAQVTTQDVGSPVVPPSPATGSGVGKLI